MNPKMFLKTISALGLSLCILAGTLFVTPISDSDFKDTKAPIAGEYQLLDDNLPEKKS